MTDTTPSPQPAEAAPTATQAPGSKNRRRRKRVKPFSLNSTDVALHPKAYRPPNEIRHPVDSPRSYLRHSHEEIEKERQRAHKSALHWTPEGNGHVYRTGEGVWGYRVRKPGTGGPSGSLAPGTRGNGDGTAVEEAPQQERRRRLKRRRPEGNDRGPAGTKRGNKRRLSAPPKDPSPPESE